MKKIELNKVKIANLNQVDMNDVKGGWTWTVISGYAITKIIEKLSTANIIDGACVVTNPSDFCGPSADCGNYSQEPTCTVSVCDNI